MKCAENTCITRINLQLQNNLMPCLSMAISMALEAVEIESEESPTVNVLLSHCGHFSCSLPWAWLLSLKMKDWPQPNTQYFFLKPDQHQMKTGPKVLPDLNFLSNKITGQCYVWQQTLCWPKLLSEKFLLDWSKLVRSRGVPLDLWTQLHHSFHYISHSPLNLIITARVSRALSGSAYGHGTELDWIGQWPHCKCITLTLPVLQSYLNTESYYYCWRVSVCIAQNMYVLGVYGAVIPVYQKCHIQIHLALCTFLYDKVPNTWHILIYTFEQARLCLYKVKYE